MTWDEFAQKFDAKLQDAQGRYGLLPEAELPAVLKSSSLPSRVVPEADYGKVEKAFNVEERPILVRSRINLNPGATDVLNHCSVLDSISMKDFELWTPSQCGAEGRLPSFDAADWTKKKPSRKRIMVIVFHRQNLARQGIFHLAPQAHEPAETSRPQSIHRTFFHR